MGTDSNAIPSKVHRSFLDVLWVFLRLGFTIPSALALMAFAYGVGQFGDISHVAWLHGLKIVAVAVVAQAVWSMARNLCPDRERVTLAVAATLLTLTIPSVIRRAKLTP